MRALAGALGLALLACDRPAPTPAADAGETPADVTVLVDDAPPEDAGVDASDAEAPASFGEPREYAGSICAYLLKGSFRVTERDLRTSFVDGDDLLALVNRSPTGALAPDYAPSDLISFAPRKARSAAECEKMQCLRKDAMAGFDALTAAMKEVGLRASLESAYRSYRSQCGTFAHWAGASNACRASQQSALPGHSQHQLGTVIDLFTEHWRASGPGVFRNGFGCNAGGVFLREQAWKYGWVVSYPIHPDDRLRARPCEPRFDQPVSINPATGYAHEAWHIRYLGVEHASAFHAAQERDETLTLEQWLRQMRGLPTRAATELPVCDGCNCGACASLDPNASACTDALPVPPIGAGAAPRILAASASREGDHWRVVVRIQVDAAASTQPPLFRSGKPGYTRGEDFLHVASVADGGARAFPVLDAYRLGAQAGTDAGSAWPYRIALTSSASAAVYDRANVALPASLGASSVSFTVPEPVLEVAILRGEELVVRSPVAVAPTPD